MSTLKIRNWEKWQSYRADRGQPPWIKIHRCVMRNPEWVALTDAQRGHLVAIWLLAADHDGVIPASPAIIRKLCYLDDEPDLKLLMGHGFIEPDANVTPDRRQHDVPETETEAETEAETEKKTTGVSFAFLGKVIRLTQSDYDQWDKNFKHIQLVPALTELDAFYSGEPKAKQAKWFQRCASSLAHKDREAASKCGHGGLIWEGRNGYNPKTGKLVSFN